MFKTENPQTGDFGLVRIPGFTGELVSLGQRMVGSGSYFTHAFLVLNKYSVIQAQPGGAVVTSLESAVGGRRVAYSNFALSDAQRNAIERAGLEMQSTPYSYLDYLALAAYRARFPLLERYIADTGHMICSQLVDEAYRAAGIELFPNRAPGDVAPGDLANLIGAS